MVPNDAIHCLRKRTKPRRSPARIKQRACLYAIKELITASSPCTNTLKCVTELWLRNYNTYLIFGSWYSVPVIPPHVYLTWNFLSITIAHLKKCQKQIEKTFAKHNIIIVIIIINTITIIIIKVKQITSKLRLILSLFKVMYILNTLLIY